MRSQSVSSNPSAASDSQLKARRYQLLKQIGQGPQTKIMLATDSANGKQVAVKQIDSRLYSSKLKNKLYQEIVYQEKLKHHPHIVSILDHYTTGDLIHIVMEYMPGGDLFNFLKDRQKDLTEVDRRRIMWQVCQAIQFMHSNGLIHRDIKPENILMNEQLNVKLCDFGWCCHLDDIKARYENAGTFEYMSPECLRLELQGTPSDIWALGILIYELYHGKEPFSGRTPKEVLHAIYNKNAVFSNDVPSEAVDVFSICVRFDPTKRANITELLQHPYFRLMQSQIETPSPTRTAVSFWSETSPLLSPISRQSPRMKENPPQRGNTFFSIQPKPVQIVSEQHQSQATSQISKNSVPNPNGPGPNGISFIRTSVKKESGQKYEPPAPMALPGRSQSSSPTVRSASYAQAAMTSSAQVTPVSSMTQLTQVTQVPGQPSQPVPAMSTPQQIYSQRVQSQPAVITYAPIIIQSKPKIEPVISSRQLSRTQDTYLAQGYIPVQTLQQATVGTPSGLQPQVSFMRNLFQQKMSDHNQSPLESRMAPVTHTTTGSMFSGGRIAPQSSGFHASIIAPQYPKENQDSISLSKSTLRLRPSETHGKILSSSIVGSHQIKLFQNTQNSSQSPPKARITGLTEMIYAKPSGFTHWHYKVNHPSPVDDIPQSPVPQAKTSKTEPRQSDETVSSLGKPEAPLDEPLEEPMQSRAMGSQLRQVTPPPRIQMIQNSLNPQATQSAQTAQAARVSPLQQFLPPQPAETQPIQPIQPVQPIVIASNPQAGSYQVYSSSFAQINDHARRDSKTDPFRSIGKLVNARPSSMAQLKQRRPTETNIVPSIENSIIHNPLKHTFGGAPHPPYSQQPSVQDHALLISSPSNLHHHQSPFLSQGTISGTQSATARSFKQAAGQEGKKLFLRSRREVS